MQQPPVTVFLSNRNRLLAGIAGIAACIAGPGSGALAADPAQTAATDLTVADFNSGEKPDNLGGDFGGWTRDPNDPMQGCIESFDRADRYGKSGFALRLIYSVESRNPAFGGLWMRLQDLDASKFGSLAFRVKGDARMGFTTLFKVELKDSMDQASHFYVRGDRPVAGCRHPAEGVRRDDELPPAQGIRDRV